MDSTSTSAIVPANHDPDEQPAFYVPLPENGSLPPASHRRPLKVFAVTLASVVFLLSFVAVIIRQGMQVPPLPATHEEDGAAAGVLEFVPPLRQPRGVAEGVSAKSNPWPSTGLSFNWTNAMLSWQRTAFHFQPAKNWMNDPNGPLYHLGYYHLFYQYNPDSAVWGNITWGHAVSTDLIHWLYLPLAMVPDQWYDINGVWTGSATILPSGDIVMIYTGDTNATVQVQNVAVPKDLSDPLLLHWEKYSGNPVMVPPTGIGKQDFRDPTTAWFLESDQKWRVAIGSKINTTGLVFVYKTEDFCSFEKTDGFLHKVPGTGMWECVDFYPLATNGSVGLDTSANGPGVKHVLKASLDDTKVDHYAIGTYDPTNDTWRPDNPEEDVGIGLRVDYGRFYASKTFFDPVQQRRILWGWINETDTAADDLQKGWASVQTVPRKVLFDTKTKSNILEWPVEEVESLRLNSTVFEHVLVEAGSVLPLDVGPATQLDIIAEFVTEAVETNAIATVTDCGEGSRDRSTFGPFGLLVIADDGLTELTPFYFRPVNASDDGTQTTYFCADETRSSLATTVYHAVYGAKVPVLNDENFTMRLLVDHSIVEGFSQGGRRTITSRIYPTKAIYGAARLFLFNNATGVNVKATLKVWHLNSAFIRPFPFQHTR